MNLRPGNSSVIFDQPTSGRFGGPQPGTLQWLTEFQTARVQILTPFQFLQPLLRLRINLYRGDPAPTEVTHGWKEPLIRDEPDLA
jgi:hypothetical protein